MSSKILVIGSSGQLATELRKLNEAYPLLGAETFFWGHNDFSVDDLPTLTRRIYDLKPSSIINCAAYTAVDRAESEVAQATKLNVELPRTLGTFARDSRAKLVHVSTDYVFDGDHFKPYVETDSPNPQSVYGRTKLEGEQVLQSLGLAGACIRTSWVYAASGQNFVKTMARLAKNRKPLRVVADQIGTPTSANSLAKMIWKTLPQLPDQKFSIYHYSNEGVTSWYDFAKEIFRLKKINIDVEAIATTDYPTPAKRPAFSLLSKSKIKSDFSVRIPQWADELSRSLDEDGWGEL